MVKPLRKRKAAASKSRSPSESNPKLIQKTRKKPIPKKKVSSDEDSGSDSDYSHSSASPKQQTSKNKKKAPAAKKPPVTKKLSPVKQAAEEPVDEKAQTGYVFFKNPKYLKMAEKLAETPSNEVKALAESYAFTLQEKIHVGNLVSGIAGKIAQYGVTADKYCYGSKTDEYLKKYEELRNGYTVAKLKDLLVLNDQPKTATKDILCERVADGLTLGKVPKCPSCMGGRYIL